MIKKVKLVFPRICFFYQVLPFGYQASCKESFRCNLRSSKGRTLELHIEGLDAGESSEFLLA